MNPDFLDLLRAFSAADVRFMDILTDLTGLLFEDAWRTRIRRPFGDVEVDFIGRDAFIQNKRATGRPQDLADIAALE